MGSRPESMAAWLRAAAATAALSALVLTGCGSSNGSEGATDGSANAPREHATEIQGLVRDDPLQVGDASLPEVTPDGTATPFAFEAPDGSLLFVAFGYTNCPDVCPTTLYDIKKALADLDPDQAERVGVAFATVDPERDTAEALNTYLSSFVTDGHALRTEDPEALTAAEDAFGITSSVEKNADGEVEVTHTAKSFVVDDQGRVVDEWAFGTTPEVMADDLRLLLAAQEATTN